MSISVYTQHMENYGGAQGENHWKFKFGNKYVVEGTDERPANAVATVMNYVARFNTNPDYSKEFVRRWVLTDEEEDATSRIEPYTILQYERLY